MVQPLLGLKSGKGLVEDIYQLSTVDLMLLNTYVEKYTCTFINSSAGQKYFKLFNVNLVQSHTFTPRLFCNYQDPFEVNSGKTADFNSLSSPFPLVVS